MAEAICGCVPGLVPKYKRLIDEGYSLPYDRALAWEEEQAIASAREAFASTIAARREDVRARGRREKQEK